MKHISITGDLGSGKSSVARLVCQQRPEYTYFSTGALQRELAAKKGMNTLDLNRASELSIDVDKYIDDFLRDIEAGRKGNATYLLDSRLAWHFVPSSFKVFLTVDPAEAARRVLNDKARSGEPTSADLPGTMDSLRERMESECRRFRHFYDIDYRDRGNYDLVIDTTSQSPQAVAEQILDAVAIAENDFSADDLAQMAAKGIAPRQAAAQLTSFVQGFPYLKLEASASVGNGILSFSQEEEATFTQAWDAYCQSGHQVLKFVPASGAASRMFKDLFAFLEAPYVAPQTDFEKRFCEGLPRFAFAAELDEVLKSHTGKSLDKLAEAGEYKTIVRYLLGAEGLNYGALPKGLLSFHTSADGVRKALSEHLVEGALYARDDQGLVHLHFTVSPEHRALFEALATAESEKMAKQLGVRFDISFSEQKPSTDTLAATADNRPFRDKGKLLFRPGGHGALIENMNDLEADIVFVKNIDNVVPDRLKPCTVHYKKVLAGLLAQRQAKAFQYMEQLESGRYSHEELIDMVRFLQRDLCCRNAGTKQMEDSELAVYLKNKLNRPMRVCGMVRNQGEPGGGPFVVYNADGSTSLQILESSQINMNDAQAAALFRQGTHFNPVDLVCALKDWKGRKFCLPKYVDRSTGFISSKSKNGQELKALELPGLWNGSMADWNTVFVEVPIDTFNPVKTVNDLLRPQHQPQA